VYSVGFGVQMVGPKVRHGSCGGVWKGTDNIGLDGEIYKRSLVSMWKFSL
jgi:hypothetical protein